MVRKETNYSAIEQMTFSFGMQSYPITGQKIDALSS